MASYRKPAPAWRVWSLYKLLALVLAGCAAPAPTPAARHAATTAEQAPAPLTEAEAFAAPPPSAAEAFRFLNRLSWGATAAEVQDYASTPVGDDLRVQLRPGEDRLPAPVQAQIDALRISQEKYEKLRSDAIRQIRPAPIGDPEVYAQPRLLAPPFSTEAYIETDRGTIRLELAVLDAPMTVESFVTLARKGFFDGTALHRVVPDFVVQAGDPRGDGEGGPGYAIRDELNQRPYLRGAVGMALDWEDTGGSQFFITHSPQPHLDAKYTIFGRVLSGMDVVDRLELGDVIRAIRIWDGTTTN